MKWLVFIVPLLIVPSGEFISVDHPSKPGTTAQSYAALLYNDTLFAPGMVGRFYAQRSWKPAWTTNGRLNEQADSLIRLLRGANAFGLIPREYHLAMIDSLLWSNESSPSLMKLDVLLTDGLFKFLGHIRRGRLLPHSVALNDRDVTRDTVLISKVETAVTTNRIASLIESQDRHEIEYRALRNLLVGKLESYERELLSLEERMARSKELTTIAINLERWRWEEKDFSGKYLLINIPAFQFRLMDHGKPVLESRVIVGLPGKETPELTSAIECFVLYPYWNVPRSIAVNELLPIIQSDPHYLTRNHFEVLSRNGDRMDPKQVNWQSFSAKSFPVRLRQREGEDNALGVIKFQFDNPYGVYLHDTNARWLFAKKDRALSHGCIRAEKSLELAHYLVEYDRGAYSAAAIDNILARRQRREIPVAKSLPIYVRYLTADGTGVYRDIYRRDAELKRAFLSYPEAVSEVTHESYFSRLARR